MKTNWCDHLMIQVPSSAATEAEKVRRMCVRPGCEFDELLDPDSEDLIWKSRNYGRYHDWSDQFGRIA